MHSRLWKWLLTALGLALVGCAGPEMSARDSRSPSWRPSPLAMVRVPIHHRSCGGKPLPRSWPDLESSGELLAPFLECASPAEFVELQRGANMAKLVERLDPWDAVRLGSLGPLRAGADVLNRKRAEFIVLATERYGTARAEVFTLFIVHSAFTSDLREVLRLLGEDKRLGQTLAQMPEVVLALERRGIRLSEYHDRAERGGDVLRGLGRAADEALASSQLAGGARGMTYFSQQGQLPAPYQKLLDEIDAALVFGRSGDVGGMVTRGIDSLTFGVPLGFYNLIAGTAHGLDELEQGHYEEAARELAAAAVMVALYAKGKAAEAMAEGQAVAGGRFVSTGWIPELRAPDLAALAQRLLERLGKSGLVQLAKYIQADREAALFVAESDEAGALRLYMANGNVEGARQLMAKMPPEPPARPGGKMGTVGGGVVEAGLGSLVDEASGFSREVVDAKFTVAEATEPGVRLPWDLEAVRKAQPVLERPPPGVAPDSVLWREHVAYYAKRLAEMEAADAAGKPKSVKPPRDWSSYRKLREDFARGIEFQRAQLTKLPELAKRLGFSEPKVQANAGVLKADLRFADALIVETDPTKKPRVVSVSMKSRNLGAMGSKAAREQAFTDGRDARHYYGGNLDIRTSALRKLGYEIVQVKKVYLLYDAAEDLLRGLEMNEFTKAMEAVANEYGVEVRLQ